MLTLTVYEYSYTLPALFVAVGDDDVSSALMDLNFILSHPRSPQMTNTLLS